MVVSCRSDLQRTFWTWQTDYITQIRQTGWIARWVGPAFFELFATSQPSGDIE
jgi:hypothetical protein